MCGRYVLSLTPSQVRRRFEDQDLPVDDAEEDDDERLRQTYNFAPGYHGLIYRAQTTGHGESESDDVPHDAGTAEPTGTEDTRSSPAKSARGDQQHEKARYKLQAAKWGLIPFWTKRAPDYAGQLKTINCRDDSLIEDRGMWTTMKKRKRCIVVAEGFYEWLKKNNGKEKIPHFVKRKDGGLMLFAGLWDMVMYEGSEEKLYTYTIITTDSNKQLNFLHDRMPVIFEAGSPELKNWLDPSINTWSKDFQKSLKPFSGELECYPVDRAVGKVGNNSPLFTVPIDSPENKKNIANFFGNQRKSASDVAAKNEAARQEQDVVHDDKETRTTTSKVETSEDNAPLPKPDGQGDQELAKHIKQEPGIDSDERGTMFNLNSCAIGAKRAASDLEQVGKTAEGPPLKSVKVEGKSASPTKGDAGKGFSPRKKTRSATTNATAVKSPQKGANAKITSFFGK